MHGPDQGGLFDCRPILCVDSAVRSIDYYVNKLGFRLGWAWSGPASRFLNPGDTIAPDFALVARGPVQLMLAEKGQGAPGMWLHLDVETADQLDALHTEWARSGAKIVEPPFVRPWGMYEMRVQDPDSHMLRVSTSPRSGVNS